MNQQSTKNFTQQDADQWFTRNFGSKTNFDDLKDNDPILGLYKNGILNKPSVVLEIGCSNGWRIHEINKLYNSKCYGVDLSTKAIESGRFTYKNIELATASAANLPFDANSFDTIIVGFCLYVCDRADLFIIANEIDRVLKKSGQLIIYDFTTPIPYKRPYVHTPGSFSYKMDYAKMFVWNPQYKEVHRREFEHGNPSQKPKNPDDCVSVVVLNKTDVQLAYPDFK